MSCFCAGPEILGPVCANSGTNRESGIRVIDCIFSQNKHKPVRPDNKAISENTGCWHDGVEEEDQLDRVLGKAGETKNRRRLAALLQCVDLDEKRGHQSPIGHEDSQCQHSERFTFRAFVPSKKRKNWPKIVN